MTDGGYQAVRRAVWVTVAVRPVRLTATKYDLLRLVAVNAGRVSTYESLICRLWNEPDAGDPDRARTFIKQVQREHGAGARFALR